MRKSTGALFDSRKLWVAVADFVGMLLVAFGVAEDAVTQVVLIKSHICIGMTSNEKRVGNRTRQKALRINDF